MILFWMKRSSMMLAITQESSLRVTGGRHIHRTSQAAGCRQFSRRHHQANSTILWTLTKGQVFTCDICSVAFRCNSILPKYNWTEFTTQDACHASASQFDALCIHRHWGKKLVQQSREFRHFTVQINPKTRGVTLCTVNVYCLVQ